MEVFPVLLAIDLHQDWRDTHNERKRILTAVPVNKGRAAFAFRVSSIRWRAASGLRSTLLFLVSDCNFSGCRCGGR